MIGHAAIEDATAAMKVSTNMPQNRATSRRCAEPARDRVCMTAAMLVLEPIFEADLPPEQYAYRPGRNAQQAVVEVGAVLDHGHPQDSARCLPAAYLPK